MVAGCTSLNLPSTMAAAVSTSPPAGPWGVLLTTAFNIWLIQLSKFGQQNRNKCIIFVLL